MNYTQTIRNYISERKGEFFEITYERKKYFHMIPDKTLMKVLNRLEDEGLLLSVAKGLYFINNRIWNSIKIDDIVSWIKTNTL